MNILYILQQSIYGNDNKWRSGDSNINMMIGLFEAMRQTKKWKDLKIDVVIGKLSDFFDIKSFDELFKDDNVKFIECDFPIDAFTNRQHFDVRFWKPLIERNYDVIVSNITEQSRNIKTLVETMHKKTKLVTQCFWMDCPEISEPKVPESYSYQWRQFDGYLCSDLCVFTCQSVQHAFVENAFHVFNKKYVDEIIKKSVIWDFGFSVTEAEKYRQPKFLEDKATILFLNRLSGINYTHHLEFIETINRIAKYQKDFEVVFTNPSGKIDQTWLEANCANVRKINSPLNREDYWKLLYESDISVHLFTLERYSGCSVRESIHAENITVVANCFEQARLVDIPELKVDIIDGEISIDSLEKSLNYALLTKYLFDDDDFKKIREKNINCCSFEAQVVGIFDKLYDLIK